MAPEILDQNYNEECDNWSIGVLLYFILGGRFPFEGNSHAEIIEKIKKGAYNPMEGFCWDKISVMGKDLVRKLLVKDVNKRINSADAMNHPWFSQFNLNSHSGD